ncbi:MAG TPA: cytochrome c, partial [Myxococcaceae bacterium]|nr:cytochrome c [Myxococcaceae bacterium]
GRGTWLVALLLCTLVACKREKGTGPLHLPQADGSVRAVPAEVVQRGLVVYRQHCSACHGDDGRGPPPGGQYLKPAPRAFTQGLFKFGDVAAGQLPRDEALKRTIRRGLHGTPMIGWVLPEDDLEALVQALKTFSPRWREEPVGERLSISADPWAGREEEAVRRGEAVYHVVGAGHAGCSTCHAAYLPHARLAELTEEATGRRPRAFAPDLYQPTPRPSDYARTLDAEGQATETVPVIVPDFLSDRLKTVWPLGRLPDGTQYDAQMQREDLYRVIAGGVGGTSMPTWKGALSEEDLWALSWYVQSLVQQRGTPEAEAHMRSLASQPEWIP